MTVSLWCPVTVAGQSFQALNVDHPQVAAVVLNDIAAGVAVYYDQRWAATERLCHFLLTEPAWVSGRTVLVLGAGLGLESLIIGRLCARLYVNDVAPGALELCTLQLRHNGMRHFVCLPGRYETLDLPSVELIVGCFLVYNRDTAAAMRQLLLQHTSPVLLINDNLSAWRRFCKQMHHTRGAMRALLPANDLPCLLFE